MSESTVAIIGSGIVGTTIAHLLTQQGHDVVIFEKGPDYPYPHNEQFADHHIHYHPNPAYQLPDDVKNYTSDGISFDLERERYMLVGGSATIWEAITIRMNPNDFRPRTLYGYGDDWPITYDDLEPYYGRAEVLMGVAGTDDDNPFAPPRSTEYPMPPFELGHDDHLMAERLREAGIVLHSTPQARNSRPYQGRALCVNIGTCRYCPIEARYSPNFHLQLAMQTGHCRLHTGVSVRRIVPDQDGGGATVIYQENDSVTEQEHHAAVLIVAAGTIESARLLLLSQDAQNPDGLGNAGGWVGRGLAFHHVWAGRMRYDEALFPFRFGGWTGQTQQFINAETRGSHAALKVEFSSRKAYEPRMNWETANNLREALEPQLQWRQIVLQVESAESPEKYVTLSPQTDRFGDPYAHVHYRFSDFDAAGYDFAREVFDQFKTATHSVESQFPPVDFWNSGSHHMGTCRMSEDAGSGVVNSFGQIHGQQRVFVVGGQNFVGSGGAINPTLTMVALAIRSADYILDQLL
jgi:glucose dehydrogenase